MTQFTPTRRATQGRRCRDGALRDANPRMSAAAYNTTAVAIAAAEAYAGVGSSFTNPPVVASAAGLLDFTLDLGVVDYVGPIHSLSTRAFGMRIPGLGLG